MALSQNTKKLIIRIVLFLVYLLLGAAIFQAIELHNEKNARKNDPFQELKKNFTAKYNISDDDMRNFLRNLKTAIKLGFDLQQGDYPDRFQWNFMNAFIFAGNVVTTIGKSISRQAFTLNEDLSSAPNGITHFSVANIYDKRFDLNPP